MPSDEQLELLRHLHKEWRVPPKGRVGKLDRRWKDKQGTQRSITLDYVGHADVTDALLEADPAWTWEPMARHPETGEPVISKDEDGNPSLWAYLTVHGVTRPCVGTCLTAANDPLKELISDMLRNGAMRFGVALSLWSKEEWAEEGVEKPAPKPRAKKAPEEPSPTPATPPAAPPATETPALGEQQSRLVERIKALPSFERDELRRWMAESKIPESISALTADQIEQIGQRIDEFTPF